MYYQHKIWDYIEFLAKTRVSSFYPMAVVKELNFPLDNVIDELNNIVRLGNRLTIEFEIRCDDCLSILKTVDDFTDYIGQKMYCEETGKLIEITKYNIYPVYKIDKTFKEYVKKKVSA